MDFWGDERGQPVQIGFILLFGILVLAFASYQGYVVPNQNANVEFQHAQTVENQFAEFDTSVGNSIGNDVERSASFSLGVQYPSRLIALNPPPVSGSLRTTAPRRVSVVNDTGADKTAEICGSDRATSRSLVYTPQYNEYAEARSTTYENTFVTRSFRERDLHGDQRLVRSVDGAPDRIDLLLLNRSVSVDRQGAYSLKIEGTHRYSQRVENPEVTISTQFSKDAWENEILGNRNDVTASDAGSGRVTLAFDGGDYEVSCAVVGLNGKPAFKPSSNGGSTVPTFDTRWDEEETVTVRQGEQVELRSEVFDRSTGELVDAATVDFSIDAGIQNGIASLENEDAETTDGVATVTVDVKDNTAGEEFGVYVTAGDDSDRISIKIPESLRSASVQDIGNSSSETQELTFTLGRDLSPGEEVTIDLSSAQAPTRVDYSGSSAEDDSTGSVSFTTQKNNEAVLTYTAGSADREGDTITVTVSDIDGSANKAERSYDVVFTGPDGDEITEQFEVSA